MLWAQIILVIMAVVRLSFILLWQGRKVDPGTTIDGRDVALWLVGAGLLYFAGAFSAILGAP